MEHLLSSTVLILASLVLLLVAFLTVMWGPAAFAVAFRRNLVYTQAYGCWLAIQLGSWALLLGRLNRDCILRVEVATPLRWFRISPRPRLRVPTPALAAVGIAVVLVSCLALLGCGSSNPAGPTPSPDPSATPPSVVYDVHVFAFSGKSADPANAITDVDQGQQFKVGLTATAYDVATGKVLPDALPPMKVTWRQKNAPIGLCVDRGALDSQVEQAVCWESTGVDKAVWEGCAKSILDGRPIGCAEYGVTVR